MGFVDGLLVVAHVGDTGAVPVHPVAVGQTDVGHRTGRHPGRADLEGDLVHVVESDLTRQVPNADREVGRVHEGFERRLQRGPSLGGTEHVEVGAVTVEGGEERQALDVVPVEVTN